MKTAKEFVEKLTKDEAFAREVSEKVQAKKDANAPDSADATVAVAAELGYEVTAEQVRKLRAAQNEEIGEEELGKAAGGTSCSVTITTTTTTLTATTATTTTLEASSC